MVFYARHQGVLESILGALRENIMYVWTTWLALYNLDCTALSSNFNQNNRHGTTKEVRYENP